MSKKTTHEQIRKITQKYLLNSGESYLIDLGNQIINYITQQEKQEKLLELYKKLNRTTFGKELLEIQEQIRELENE